MLRIAISEPVKQFCHATENGNEANAVSAWTDQQGRPSRCGAQCKT